MKVNALLLFAAIAVSPLSIPAQPNTSVVSPLVVKNIPFAAQEVTTVSSILPDGTTATTNKRADIARNSAGSVRRDVRTLANSADPMSANGTTYSVFHDEVNHRAVRLDPAAKIAIVTNLIAWSKPYAPSVVVPADASSVSPIQSLGYQSISGWMATGTRQTFVLPAGTRGSQAVRQTVDTWYSADLQTNVLTQTQDSSGSTTTTALQKIATAEPDPVLFSVPQDYTITTTGK